MNEKHCTKCGSPMVQRMNRLNGNPFLGCSTYPKCIVTTHDHDRMMELWNEIGEDDMTAEELDDGHSDF